ncbi:MAG: FAD:protein FMN transferase [Planctomycetes bacterium]|nr:FAD:protein FMN transferase [Planctomycetota bacterium]
MSRRSRFRIRARLRLLLLAGLAACSGRAPVVHELRGPTMGSHWCVKFVGDTPPATVQQIVTAELERFDLAFSQWRQDSEITRVNAHASIEPLVVSELFASVLGTALVVAAASEGAFDPTVKPLSDLYRAAKQDPQHRLDPAAMAAAAARVDYRALSLQGRTLTKTRVDVTVDLDGLVAGAAADTLAERLSAAGLPAFFLDITGEILCRGEKAPGVPWEIGVTDPTADLTGSERPVAVLPLRDAALCTSGHYRNAMTVDGEYVHHVFDPRTGHNPELRVVSATVLAPRAVVADALGTALMVLGPVGARRLWPEWRALGVQGALLLVVGADGELTPERIDWPADR